MGDRTIVEAIQAMTNTQLSDTVYSYDGSVVSVSEADRTCVCTVVSGKDSYDIPDVRLMAAVDDGVFIIPSIGSTVSLIKSTYGEPYITSYSEVDKIVLMGGDLGGMVKLLSALSSLNKIEDDINNLKKAFNAWVVSPNDGGAALKASASSWASNRLVKTERTDLENINITQG